MSHRSFSPPLGLQSSLAKPLYATTRRLSLIPRALSMRFLRYGRIFRSDGGKDNFPSLNPGATASRRPAPRPSLRARREDRALPIVPMSSDRLFLDRVARQHCPSPLHRRDQINRHSPSRPSKPDISTLRRIGHFYFALTVYQKRRGKP
jgi:hypothetical protein